VGILRVHVLGSGPDDHRTDEHRPPLTDSPEGSDEDHQTHHATEDEHVDHRHSDSMVHRDRVTYDREVHLDRGDQADQHLVHKDHDLAPEQRGDDAHADSRGEHQLSVGKHRKPLLVLALEVVPDGDGHERDDGEQTEQDTIHGQVRRHRGDIVGHHVLVGTDADLHREGGDQTEDRLVQDVQDVQDVVNDERADAGDCDSKELTLGEVRHGIPLV
jgi:hypothetical protein